MNIPEIYAKAAMNHDQIQVKKELGCNGIEIQLLSELKGDNTWYTLESVFNLKEFENEPVSIVHAPLLSGYGDMTLEQMADIQDCTVFYETCRLADFFGKKQNKIITVVVHSETFLGFIEGLEGTFPNIEQMIFNALNQFSNIQIGIENVSPLRGIGKGNSLHLANNFKFDNVELVNKLRKDLNTNRIGTVLDTCHAMLAKKYIDCLYNEIGDRPYEDLSLDAYFRENKDTCFLIHLCGMKGSGYGKGKHGTAFHLDNPEELSKCLDIIKLYNLYNYSCPITLEIEESDFSICDGYKCTKETVIECFNRGVL